MFSYFLFVDMEVGKIGNLSNKIISKPPELAHETREKIRNIFWRITLSRYSVFFVGKILLSPGLNSF